MRVHVSKVNSILKQTLSLFPVLIPATNHRFATAFCVSTIILGAENLNLKSDLNNKGIATTSAILSTTIQPLDMSKYRLPKSVKPVKYDLYLYPNLTTGNFSGKVLANVVVNEDTPFVKMHNKKLAVKKVSINDEDAVAEIDEEFELLVIKKANGEVIRKSDSTNIEVVFEGDMKNRIVGLYTSTYQGKDGPRTIATSKFEPTYARQAFPCFDEPNMKASFKVHLWKPSNTSYIALSNNPVESEEDFDGGKLVHFEETVPMSTYLSCFIVSDFQCTSTEFANDGKLIPFKVYATPEQLIKTKYAGTVGKNIIEYYVKYFGIAYPLPKLDMVAIPDFVSGAMEHWGLVTYRETALLYTNETHSSINKQRVLVVIAHELAHSWFGNLVTMDWWDNLWLNEGFASYIEYKGANAAEPTFGMMDQFIVETLHPVLNLDAKLSSHPIIKPVITPDQITEVFDPISYNKGASILRMLEYAVGSNTFSVGVKNYLNKYKYGNAVTKDLWDEIQNIVGSSIDVTTFMDSFTVQMGYPILDISESNGKWILKQRRFLTNFTNAKDENSTIFGYRWTIPITFLTDKSKSDTLWFKYDDEQVEIDKPDNIKWMKFNPNQIGYYRVNYTTELWSRLSDHFHELEVADRTHVLEEAFSIANAGQLNYKIPLDITENLKNEMEYLPWKTAGNKFGHLKRLLRESPHEPQFKKYVISILKTAHDNLSWNIKAEDSHLQRLARIQVLTLACEFGYDFAIEKASTLHDIWLQNRIADPDLRSIIYKYGMINATEYKWSKVSKLFEDEKDANEKLKLLTGLAAVQDPYLLKRLIEAAKSESYIRSQDYFACLQYIASNPVGTPIVWDYVRENWQYLVNRFTLNDRYLGRLITTITSSFATKTKLAEVENFFKMNPEAGAGAAARKEALENINNNINWLEKFQRPVEEWITRSN